MLRQGHSGEDLGGGVLGAHLVEDRREQHRAELLLHRAAEVGHALLPTGPAEIHLLQDLADPDRGRAVQHEAEAPRVLVMEEEHDAALEVGVEHLRHGHQQDRRGEIGAAHGHGAQSYSASRLWEKSNELISLPRRALALAAPAPLDRS